MGGLIRYRCTGATTARLSRTLATVRATLAASTALRVAGRAGPRGAVGSMSHHAQTAPVTASVAVSSPAARRLFIRSYGLIRLYGSRMSGIRQKRLSELTDVLLSITATRGLDQVSVREVAAAAGVSIGTVQHYFATKDEMLVFAFREVVERTRTRLAGIDAGTGPRPALGAALRELLPLDQARLAECRVYLAFAARAATSPALAAVQRETLSAIYADLEQALTAAAARHPGPAPDTVVEARLLLAVVDGLVFDAVSAPGTLTPADMEAA